MRPFYFLSCLCGSSAMISQPTIILHEKYHNVQNILVLSPISLSPGLIEKTYGMVTYEYGTGTYKGAGEQHVLD